MEVLHPDRERPDPLEQIGDREPPRQGLLEADTGGSPGIGREFEPREKLRRGQYPG
jgi:hypothetical protein